MLEKSLSILNTLTLPSLSIINGSILNHTPNSAVSLIFFLVSDSWDVFIRSSVSHLAYFQFSVVSEIISLNSWCSMAHCCVSTITFSQLFNNDEAFLRITLSTSCARQLWMRLLMASRGVSFPSQINFMPLSQIPVLTLIVSINSLTDEIGDIGSLSCHKSVRLILGLYIMVIVVNWILLIIPTNSDKIVTKSSIIFLYISQNLYFYLFLILFPFSKDIDFVYRLWTFSTYQLVELSLS